MYRYCTRTIGLLACFLSVFYAQAQLELNCDNDSTGMIPLTDMGYSYYGPFRGGLYPNFENEMPATHLNKGKDLSNAMLPLDSAGNVDWVNGEVLVIGMGGSTASNAFNTMLDSLKTWDWEGTNRCMKLKGLFYGGKDLQRMIDTLSTDYWDFLQDKLDSRGDSWDKVQVVWILTHSEMETTDSILFIKNMVSQYITLLQRLQDSMANVKQVFFSGFHYTGYTHPSHELYTSLAEPKAYWGNLAIKMLIERQLAGDPQLAFEGPGKKVPFISWGPYFWADGMNPRATDGLIWPCAEYRDDDTGGGFHLEDPGKAKEALMFIDFLETNELTSKWYLDGAAWFDCPELAERKASSGPKPVTLHMFPNPAAQWVNLTIPANLSGEAYCTLTDMRGHTVLHEVVQLDATRSYTMPVQQYPNGMYMLSVSGKQGTYMAKLIVQH